MLSTTTSAPASWPSGGEPGDVGDAQERVRGRLDPHDPRRALLEGGLHRGQVAHVDDAEADAPRAQDAGDEAMRAAVHVAAEEHLVAGAQHRPQQGVFGGEPRREREAVRAALDRGELPLQRGARRIAAAAVLVAAAKTPDPVLDERRREVHGRDDGARRGIELLSGVDGEARESTGGVLGGHAVPPEGESMESGADGGGRMSNPLSRIQSSS